MALYVLECTECKSFVKKIAGSLPKINCSQCGRVLTRKPLAQGSTSVMEVLDNGVMVKKLERFRDIEELRSDHGSQPEKKDGEFV